MIRIKFALYAMPCYPGSMSLPPVICMSFTGRSGHGRSIENFRGGFFDDGLCMGRIDAPDFIPAGSHCAPRITLSGKPLIERPSSIYPREIEREGRK